MQEDKAICGLVGVAGKIGFNEEKAFRTLLNIDTIRGPHSTGVAFTDTYGNVQVFKKLGTPWELYDSSDFKARMRSTHNMLMGHNRYATQGGINKNNAHPFEFDSLVGCHNGTLTKQWLLDDAKDFDVDSENIYHHMEINGVSDTVENLAGAFALVWYNKDENTLNFVRNNQRPLFYCYTKDRKTLFWASEHWMLIAALGRENIEHQDVQTVKELQHYSFTLPLGFTTQAQPFDKVRIRGVKGYVDVFQKSVGGSRGYSQGQSKTPSVPQTTPKTKTEVEKKDQELRPFLNQEVEFWVQEISTPSKGVNYVGGVLVDDPGISIRCYCYNRKDLWSDLSEAVAENIRFSGFVKASNPAGDGYLLLDNRTVQSLGKDEEDDNEAEIDDLYTIQNGVMVSGKEFDQKTNHGCAWCSSPVSRDDAPSLHWIDSDEFICEGCKDTPEVKEFLH